MGDEHGKDSALCIADIEVPVRVGGPAIADKEVKCAALSNHHLLVYTTSQQVFFFLDFFKIISIAFFVCVSLFGVLSLVLDDT